MTTAPARPEVIDSDGHVVEPDTVWKEYAEPEFREQLDRAGRWRAGARDQARVPGRANPRRCRDRRADDESWADDIGGETWDEESRTKMGRPGGYDPHARLRRHGRRRHRRRGALPDRRCSRGSRKPTLFGAACRAYNNWLRDYCSAAPTRLYGVGAGAAPGRRRRDRRDATLRRAARVQGRHDPAGGVPRRQEAEPPRLRPVLARRRRARLPDRHPPVAAPRHAERVPAARPRRGRDRTR